MLKNMKKYGRFIVFDVEKYKVEICKINLNI